MENNSMPNMPQFSSQPNPTPQPQQPSQVPQFPQFPLDAQSQQFTQANQPIQSPSQPPTPSSVTPAPKPHISLKEKLHSKTPNQNLVFLSVILGVITIIATTVAIWTLVNSSSSTRLTATNFDDSNVTAVKEVDLSAKILGFFPNKITNPTADVIYRLGAHRTNAEGKAVIGAYINTTNKAVEVYVYWEFVNGLYGVTTDRTDRELFTLEFDQTISDITIAESSEDPGRDIILILLSDGTVQYVPVLMSLQTKTFQASGQLAGVADVVKFYNTDAVSDTGDFSGYRTTLAQRSDGSIIDLKPFLISATNPEQTSE